MTFKEALIVIKTSIETTAIAAVKALKAHTFRVQLENPELQVKLPQTQKIEGRVSVDNFPAFPTIPKAPKSMRVAGTVSVTEERLDDVLKALGEVKTAIGRLPTKYPEVKVPPYPKVTLPKFPDIPKPVKEVSVSNLETLIGSDPKRYIPVRLSDGEAFYEAISSAVSRGIYAFSDSSGGKQQGLVDADRHVQVDVVTMPQVAVEASAVSEDQTLKYQVSDTDTANTTRYYGFLDKDGGWYILEEDSLAGTYRYCRGDSAYAGNWTNRASLDYGLYSEVF